jgi:hypothetical protein
MTDELPIEHQAKLAEIAMRLTRYLPVDEQAIILAVGTDTASPTPYRVSRSNGVISVSLVLADGSVRHIGEFDASQLDEPLADEQ